MSTLSFRELSAFQKSKYIIIGIYILLNLVILLISLRMNIDDLRFLVKMAHYIPYMRYFAITNILLFLIVLFMNFRELRGLRKQITDREDEILKLKSRMYDLGDQGIDKESDDKENLK